MFLSALTIYIHFLDLSQSDISFDTHILSNCPESKLSYRTNFICCREYIFLFCEFVLIWFEPIEHFLSIWWGLSFKY